MNKESENNKKVKRPRGGQKKEITRSKGLYIKITPEERDMIKHRAALVGGTISDYVRSSALGYAPGMGAATPGRDIEKP